MRLQVLLAGVLALGSVQFSGAVEPVNAGMLNLNCLDALVSVDQAKLAGVFSFIADKDSSAAFADLVAHDASLLKKYAARLEKDFKAASGIAQWDHDVLLTVLSLYASPLGETMEKPSAKLKARLTELSMAPTLTLEQVTARRKK